jgi:hypothetical protein
MHEGMNIDELTIHEVEQVGYDEKPMPNQYRVYTEPPQREKVYCGCGDEIVADDGARCGTCVAVKYKAKEWVGLTDDEAADFVLFHAVVDEECIRAIEAKLKEKNNG